MTKRITKAMRYEAVDGIGFGSVAHLCSALDALAKMGRADWRFVDSARELTFHLLADYGPLLGKWSV